MFRLTADEWEPMSSSQIVMMDGLPKNVPGKYLPYAFYRTWRYHAGQCPEKQESSTMNIAIVRLFIGLADLRYELQRSGRR